MTTRRTVLGLAVAAGVAGGAGIAAAARARRSDPRRAVSGVRRQVARGDLLVAEFAGGELAVIDAATGRVVLGPAPSVLSGDGSCLVRAEQAGAGTRLVSHRLPGGDLISSSTLADRLAARATSPDGSVVALATPAGGGSGPYRPGARKRTTIVVADSAGQRARIDLPGNLEPEAFDRSGQFLFVLDYVPPSAPDRYRVRAVEVASGRLQPLLTRSKVPTGAEEEMRGEGRQAVYDPRTRRLFTLYVHQPDHVHSRDLPAGARRDAPHVHAFVHTLSLDERWAYCIDLPAPFGQRPASAHAVALAPGGETVCVVETTSGRVAVLDPVSLTVAATFGFPTQPDTADAASAAFSRDGDLLVGAGREVVTLLPGRGQIVARWPVDTAVRGLAPAADGVYAGQDGAVLQLDRGTGRVRRRIEVPGLVSVRHLAPTA